ncbi:MAG: tetratricopeptide repeat protein [Chloroflexota bacterium]
MPKFTQSQNRFKSYLQTLGINIMLFLGLKRNAMAQLEKARQDSPEDYNLLLFTLQLHRNEENWEEYLKLYAQFERFHTGELLFNRNFGSTLLNFGHYEEAAARLRYCVENWNLDARHDFEQNVTLAQLAVCYINLGMLDAASTTNQRVSEKKHWNADVIYAQLLFKIAASQSGAIPDFLDEQIKKYPWLPCLYYWKGQYVHDYLHNSQSAYQLFKTALERTNYFRIRSDTLGNGFGGEFYANIFSMLQSAVTAYMQFNKKSVYPILWLTCLTKLKTLDKFIDIPATRIYILIEGDAPAKAEKMCQKALKKPLNKRTTDYLALLALAQKKLGKLDEGVASARQAVTLNYYNDEAWTILGDIQILQKDWDSAIHTHKEITKANPYDFRAWKKLGICCVNTADLASAQSAFEKAVQINPSEADAWVDLGDVYARLGNSSLAVSAYQNGLKYNWLEDQRRNHASQEVEKMNS